MVAGIGYRYFEAGRFDTLDIDVHSRA
jgi:hypothetical protein